MLRYVLFDLDETLYPASNPLMPALRERMRGFVQQRLGVGPLAAEQLSQRYFFEYGTTLRGLQIEQRVDPQDYLDFLGSVDPVLFLFPDLHLREMLETIPQGKYIFTNADRPHAERVLKALGIAGQFDEIFDIASFDWQPKPAPVAYQRALATLQASPHEVAVVDDQARNILGARALGLPGILVGTAPDGEDCPCAASIYDVALVLAGLDGQD